MTTNTAEFQLPANFKKTALFLSIIVTAIGLIVLLGWLLNISFLKSISPGWISMKPNTALCFSLAGISMLLLHRPLNSNPRFNKLFPLVIAGIYGSITAIIGVQYLFNINLEIDELIFTDDIDAIATTYAGRMAPATVVCFLLLSFSELFNKIKIRKFHIFQIFPMVAGIISFVVLSGYFFGAEELVSCGGFTTMAFHTALCFFLLTLASLFARPREGLMKIVSSNTVGGRMIRNCFPLVVVTIFLFSWLHLQGELLGLYNMNFGIGILLVAFFISFSVVLFLIADSLIKFEADLDSKRIERKKAEEALRFSEMKFHTLFDSTSDAVILLNNIRFFDCNPATLKMFGCPSKEEFCSKHPADLSPLLQPCGSNSFTLAKEQIAIALEKGNNNFEWLHLRADTGEVFQAEVLLNRMELNGESVLQAAVRDISERKKKEEESIENKRLFGILYNQTPVMLHSINNKGELMSVSDYWLEKLGYTREEVLGRKFTEFLTEDSQQYANETTLPQFYLSGHIENADYSFVKNNGEVIDCILSAITHRDKNKNFIRSLAVITDITPRKKTEQELADSEQKFRSVLQTAQEAVILADEKRNIIYWNDAAEKMFGYNAGEVLNKPLTIIMPEEFKRKFLERDKHANDTEQSPVIGKILEFRGQRKDGTEFPMEHSISSWDSETGKIYCGIIRDISNRKRDEEKLRAAHDNIQLLLDSIAEGAYGVDTRGNCTFVNRSFLRLLGYQEAGELIGKQIHVLIHHSFPDGKIYPARECKMLNSRLTKQHINVSDEVFWRKDGVAVPVEYWSYPIIREDKVIGAICTFIDITERKRASEALTQSETNLRAIFENTQTGFLLMGTDYTILNFNQRASVLSKRAFGKELQINARLIDLLPNERKDLFLERQSKALNGETVSYEISYPQANNSNLWLDINSKPVINGSDLIVGISFAINDISERKKTEKKLLETIKEIDTFIFRSSHDLKSPVSSLKGLIQLMKKEISDIKTLEYLIMVEKANIRMEDIVNDLSSVVLIKDERRESSEINLFQEINSIIDLHGFSAIYDKIRYDVGVDKDFRFFSDRTLVSTICQNLIGNAIKYRLRDMGHIITINARQYSNGVLLTVSDNGEGISIKPIEKIFEMFYRGNLKSTGTGLGLYIVKKAVEKLGGTIQVESEPNKGATFSVYLPLAQPRRKSDEADKNLG